MGSAIEAAIRRDPLFDQACVIGEGRPCLVAVISLNPGRWTFAASELGADAQAPNTASAAILHRINRYDLPKYAQVRAVHLVLEPWTVQQGLLTPTLKIKRQAVQEKYASEIEALYVTLQEISQNPCRWSRVPRAGFAGWCGPARRGRALAHVQSAHACR